MEGSPKRREVLPLSWVKEALYQANDLGIGSVFLTGGEPLMYPHFREVARAVASMAGIKTTVCTNGTLVRPSDAEFFSTHGFDVHISIDGEAIYHDDFRAVPGAFLKAELGAKLMVDAGVPLTIVTTISQANFEYLDWIFAWVKQSGAERLLVQPLLDLGRGAAIRNQRLSTNQLNSLIMRTSDFANSSKQKIKASIIGGSKRHFIAHPCAAYVCNGGGCHRGVSAEIKKIVVRENGLILPEATNLSPRYAIGHVDEGSLSYLVGRYFPTGYAAFDKLCRSTYEHYVPEWPDAVLPWDQLLAELSFTEVPESNKELQVRGCGSVMARLKELSPDLSLDDNS
jgi:Fe-coproporphyrin III synthase